MVNLSILSLETISRKLHMPLLVINTGFGGEGGFNTEGKYEVYAVNKFNPKTHLKLYNDMQGYRLTQYLPQLMQEYLIGSDFKHRLNKDILLSTIVWEHSDYLKIDTPDF